MLEPEAIVFEELATARRTLRIAVVTETYAPELNGVAVTAARFVEGLRALDHQIQLVRPRQGAADVASTDEILVKGVAIPRYPDLKLGLPAKRSLERLWSLRRPDVVHIVTEGPLGWSALRAAAKLKLPVVSDFRTNFHAYSAHYGVGWLKKTILGYLRKFHNRTLCTLVPTAALRTQLAALGFYRLKVVARGVDTALFNPARRDERLRAEWGAGRDDLVLLYVGRIAAEKNLATLIEVHKRLPDTRLVLVGEGPLRRELAGRYPRLLFVGRKSGADLARHYASGDIFLFPSLTETYGNVTLEAMASGLAVLAFDYAAAAEVIRHGTSGVLAPYGDNAAFVSQTEALTENTARARALAMAARPTAESYGWDAVVRELESVLIAAADAGAAGRGIVFPRKPKLRFAPGRA